MTFHTISYNDDLKPYVKSMWNISYESAKNEEGYLFQEYITFASAFPSLIFQLEGEDFLKTSINKKSIGIPRHHFTGIIVSS